MHRTHAVCSRYHKLPQTERFTSNNIYFAPESAICSGLNRDSPSRLPWVSAKAVRRLLARLVRRLAGVGGWQLSRLAQTPLCGPSRWLGRPHSVAERVHFPKKGNGEQALLPLSLVPGSPAEERGFLLLTDAVRWPQSTGENEPPLQMGAPRF